MLYNIPSTAQAAAELQSDALLVMAVSDPMTPDLGDLPCSRSADSKTMFGDLPPSSSDT